MTERLGLLDGHLSPWLQHPWCAACGSRMVERDCDHEACVKRICTRCGAVTVIASRVCLETAGRPR